MNLSSIYVNLHGQTLGPISEEQLESMIRIGTVTPDDLHWIEGYVDWVPIRQVFPWQSQVEPSVPPPPRHAPAASTASPNTHSLTNDPHSLQPEPAPASAAPSPPPQEEPSSQPYPSYPALPPLRGRVWEYANYWRRLGAHIVDQFILLGFVVVCMFTLGYLKLITPHSPIAGLYVSCFILNWLYYAMQESSAKQATFGKRGSGIIVTDMQGQRLTLKRAALRSFWLTLFLFTFPPILIVNSSKRIRCLPEILSGCQLHADRRPRRVA